MEDSRKGFVSDDCLVLESHPGWSRVDWASLGRSCLVAATPGSALAWPSASSGGAGFPVPLVLRLTWTWVLDGSRFLAAIVTDFYFILAPFCWTGGLRACFRVPGRLFSGGSFPLGPSGG